jgi:hypothetical protein
VLFATRRVSVLSVFYSEGGLRLETIPIDDPVVDQIHKRANRMTPRRMTSNPVQAQIDIFYLLERLEVAEEAWRNLLKSAQ